MVLTAAPTGQGVGALASALAALARALPPPVDQALFQLPMDRVFALPGIGPVVTGTLRRGRIAVGEEVEVLPAGRRARVRSLQLHGQPVAAAAPGRRVAVALRGIALAELGRGMVLASPGAIQPGAWPEVRLAVLASAPAPLADGAVLRLLTGTHEVAARLRLPAGGALSPGATGLAQLHCEPAVAAMAGDGFVLRRDGRSIGGGTILDPLAGRRRSADRTALPRLQAAAAGDWAAATMLLLRERGTAGGHPTQLVLRLGQAAARLRGWALAAGGHELTDGTLLHPEAWAGALDVLRAALAAFHAAQPMEAGMRPEALRTALPLAAPVAEALLATLLADGSVTRSQGLLRIAGFDPIRAMVGASRDLALGLAAAFRAAGLMPPDAAAVVAGDPQRVAALRFLLQRGVLVRTVDQVQRRAVVFHRDALDQAKRRIAATLARPEGFTAGEAGALLGISRKYSIPLLEHLDAIRFTRRVGDRRFVDCDAAAGDQAAGAAR